MFLAKIIKIYISGENLNQQREEDIYFFHSANIEDCWV